MKNIVLLFLIISFSCVNKKVQEMDKSDLISKSLKMFYESNDKNTLLQTYDYVEKNNKKEEVLLRYRKEEVINLFMLLKKYSELKEILNTQSTLSYNDKLVLNLLDYLEFNL